MWSTLEVFVLLMAGVGGVALALGAAFLLGRRAMVRLAEQDVGMLRCHRCGGEFRVLGVGLRGVAALSCRTCRAVAEHTLWEV